MTSKIASNSVLICRRDGHLAFSDEAVFYTNEKVNKYNVRIWGGEHPHITLDAHEGFTKCITSPAHIENLEKLFIKYTRL